MKILHVIHRYVDTSQRGSELYTSALCRHLAANHEVAVLYTSPAAAEGHLHRATLNGLTTFVLGAGAPWGHAKLRSRSQAAERAFRTVLSEWRPDVVHFQHLLFHSLRLPGIAARAGVPSVFTLHDFWLLCPQINLLDHREQRSWPINRRNCLACCEASLDRSYTWRQLSYWKPKVIAWKAIQMWYLRRRRPRLAGRVFRDVDLFVAPSRHVGDRFIEVGLPASKLVVCGHGIEHDMLPADYRPTVSQDQPLRCGFVGTVAPYKGMDVLLDAFEAIDGATLTVYGAAPPAYTARARDQKVRFMGEIGEGGRADAFSHMDVLLVPSIWFENSSLVTLEAFLFGVPVVASDIGALAELVADGRSGLLFKVGDPRDLRAKVERLAKDRVELARLAANVPRVKSSSEHASEIEALYERVIADHRSV